MNDKKINCLILTGMHRSGISPLVQCLSIMGVDFGQSRLNKDADDAVESTAIGAVTMTHDILLRDLGCRWDMVGALPEDWLDTKAAAHARERIGHLIEDQFQNIGLWAVADPRLCRLLPLWNPVLQEKGLNPGIILTIRHPWEVAQSMKKNKGMDLKQSHLLWLAMNKEVFDFCQQHAYMVNTFDQMLADPAAILRDIEEQFGLTFPNPLQQQIYRILDVVRPEFKHHNRRGGTQSDSNGKSYYPFAWLYDQINNHKSALKLLAQESSGDADADRIAKEALPTRLYPVTLPGLNENMAVKQQSSRQGNKIFNSFLTLLGQYERDQRNIELQKMQRILNRTQMADTLYARLYTPIPDKEDESDTTDVLLARNEWQQVRFSIPRADLLKTEALNFSPMNTRGVVSISALSLVNAATDTVCWQANSAEMFNTINLSNAIQLPGEDALVVMTITDNAILTLPILSDLPDCPLAFQAWIKVDTSQQMVALAWQTLQNQKSRLKTRLDEALADQKTFHTQLEEKDRILAEKEKTLSGAVEKSLAEQVVLQKEIEETAEQLANSQSLVTELENTVETILNEKETTENHVKKLSSTLNSREEWIDKIENELGRICGRQETERQESESADQKIEAKAKHQERIDILDQAIAGIKAEKERFEKQLSPSSAELSRRQNRISDLSKKLEQVKHDLNENKDVSEKLQLLTTVNNENETLQRKINEQESILQEVEGQLQDKNKEMERNNQERSRLVQLVKENEQALGAEKSNIHIRFQELAELTRILKDNENRLDKQSTELAAKTAQNETVSGRVNALKNELSLKNNLIHAKEEELNASSAELGQKSRQVAIHADRIKKFMVQLAKKTDSIKTAEAEKNRLTKQLMQKDIALQAKEIEIDIQRKRNADLKTTASWKMMAPMRALARPFRKASYKHEPAEVQIERIKESDLFNTAWYLDQYPDVAENAIDPAEHYLYFGVSEGRDPGPKFHTVWYLKTYPDVAETGVNPLIHYIKKGKEEGRHPNASAPIEEQIELVKESNLFDAQWYLERYLNVREAGMDPAMHYCHFGAGERKDPGPDFDTTWYTENYPDVAESGINPLVHYLSFGEKEGRKCKSS